jgi:hypothetical protein
MATALSEITYHLLCQLRNLTKLKEELASAMPDPTQLPPVGRLEQHSYLKAIVKKELRLSSGISTRL